MLGGEEFNRHKNIMRNKTFLLSFFLLFINSLLFCQSADKIITAKIDSLFDRFDSTGSPGAAVVVVRGNKIIYQNEYGTANLEYGIAINPETVFHIGSVSKQFTAFAILLLESRHKLSIDDDIRKYLPELPDFGDTIRISNLLHHTSGLREMETLLQICGISTADEIDADELMRLIIRQRKLNFKPGEKIEYSNTGYFLLARIVEKITGESFAAWTSENIFKPLGMRNSMFYNDCTVIVKNRAYPYWRPGGENRLSKGILSYSYTGPTSVFTTSDDIAKWLINFSVRKTGGKEIIDKMLNKTGRLNDGELLDYGYGLGITNFRGHKVVLHSGQDAAYRVADFYFPGEKLGIAILSNYYSIDPLKYGYEIAGYFLKEVSNANETGEVENKNKSGSRRKPHNYKASHSELKSYEGKYFCDELETMYTIVLSEGILKAKHWRNEDTELHIIERDLFEGNQYWFHKITFVRDNKNRITGFKLDSARAQNLFFRLMK